MTQKKSLTTVDQTAGDFLKKFEKSLQNYAMRNYDHAAFLKSAMIAIVNNIELQKCLATEIGKESIFNALRYASATGLSLNPQEGKAALIAYNGQVKYQVMKNGLVELIMASGKVEYITADYIRENDEFVLLKSSDGDRYEFSPAMKDRGDVTGFFAALKLKSGTTHTKYMSKDEVEFIRDSYSSMYKAKPELSPWNKNFLGMGVKTVIKALLRTMTISDDLDNALGADDFYANKFDDDSGPSTADATNKKLKTEKKEITDNNGSLL